MARPTASRPSAPPEAWEALLEAYRQSPLEPEGQPEPWKAAGQLFRETEPLSRGAAYLSAAQEGLRQALGQEGPPGPEGPAPRRANLEEALKLSQLGLAGLKGQYRLGEARGRLAQAECLLALGRVIEALALLDNLAQYLEHQHSLPLASAARRAEGQCLTRLGRLEDAEKAFLEAVRLASSRGCLGLEARAWEELGWMRLMAGRLEEAWQAQREVLDISHACRSGELLGRARLLEGALLRRGLKPVLAWWVYFRVGLQPEAGKVKAWASQLRSQWPLWLALLFLLTGGRRGGRKALPSE